MSNESIDKLLDLLVDALEERMAARAASPTIEVSETPTAGAPKATPTDQPLETENADAVSLVTVDKSPQKNSATSNGTDAYKPVTQKAASVEVTPITGPTPQRALSTPVAVERAPVQVGVSLPLRWKPYLVEAGVEKAQELPPAVIVNIIRSNRKLLRLLTPAMISALPAATFAAVPDYVLARHGVYFQDELDRRKARGKRAEGKGKQRKSQQTPQLSTNGTEFPARWNSFTEKHKTPCLEKATPQLVEDVVATDPDLLGELTTGMLAVLPANTLAAVPSSTLERHGVDFDDELSRRARVNASENRPKTTSSASDIKPATSEELPLLVVDPPDENIIINPSAQQAVITDNMPKTLGRIFVVLFVCILLANIRLDTSFLSGLVGTNLVEDNQVARNSSAALLDGALVQVSFKREVYLIEEGKRHWITTPEAFEAAGYRWNAVRTISNEMFDRFEEGEPVNLLLKCPNSPHVFVYTLEEKGSRTRVKHYIKDIATFTAQGYEWQDVNEGYCGQLSRATKGDPIPADFSGRIPNS